MQQHFIRCRNSIRFDEFRYFGIIKFVELHKKINQFFDYSALKFN